MVHRLGKTKNRRIYMKGEITMVNNINRTTRKDGIIISTVEPLCMAWYGKYETAVSFDGGHCWIIAEGYDNYYSAVEGHTRYSKMSREELENNIDWVG